ncbi:MAG: sulfatase [Lentisphaeria bacterium]|nr:sulfatase [Lentisphaeria bacterium]
MFKFCTLFLLFCVTLKAENHPNILFISIDDLRNELGIYGQTPVKSPHIDQLAKEGLVFDNAYTQVALCSPARTTVMTGVRPATHKVMNLQTHFRKALPDVVTLAQFFKQQGYMTQAIGKIYHRGLDDKPSWTEKTRMGHLGGYQNPVTVKSIKERLKTAKEKGLKGKALRLATKGPAYESVDVADDAYNDGANTSFAIRQLKSLAKNKQAFFLAMGYYKPHLPFNAPKKYWDLYNEDEIAAPAITVPPKDSHDKFTLAKWGEIRSYQGVPQEGPMLKEMIPKLRHGYLACVSYIDAQIGRLMEALKETGLDKNTIVILWSDHGFKIGEYGAWCKHSNMEIDNRVPLILKVPGELGNKRTDALVELVDIYPSLVELAGFKQPKHLEGKSFAALIKTPKLDWKTAAFSQYNRGSNIMGYSIRTAKYRYTEWTKIESGKVVFKELYDQQNDPLESQNIANQEQAKELVQMLSKQLKQGWQKAGN